MEINLEKAYKKWSPVLENMGVKDEDRKLWMSEYSELHAIRENAYSNQGNLAGMGDVISAQPFGVGRTVGTTGVYKGSGDYGQQLLPVSMKVAAQTIGMDLVAVKPSPGPKIDLMYVDFRYDDTLFNGDEKPQMFKLKVTNQDALNQFFYDGAVTTYNAVQIQGGLSKRIWVNLAGTNTVTANDAEPTGSKAAVLEFLGFSRIDGFPMFRAYRQANTASSGGWAYDATKNSFGATAVIATVLAAGFEAFVGGAGTSGADTGALAGVTVDLISALEDQIAGFAANFESFKYPQTRGSIEQSYPGIIAPDVFTKTIQIGSLEVGTAVKKTEMMDYKSTLGINILDKMESILVNELSQTISKQIVDKVFEMGYLNRQSAPKRATANIADGTIFDFDIDAYLGGTAPGGETSHAVQRKLITKVMIASNYLATEGRIGPAQYIVTNGRLAGALQDIAGYTINPVKSKMNASGQLYPVGTIGDIAIYVDPYKNYNDNDILIGRKNAVDQPGIVFIPYLMAQSVSFVSEGLNGGNKLIMTSRYAVSELGFYPQKQYMTIRVFDGEGFLA